MSKKVILFLMFLFCLLSINTNVFAYNVPDYVRIGLTYKYKSVDSIPISNNSIYFGFESSSGFVKETLITSQNGFTMNTSNLYYVKLDQNFNTYSAAKNAADNFSDYKAIPAFLDKGKWAVYLGGFNTLAEANTAKSKSAGNSAVLQQSLARMELRSNSSSLIVFDSPNVNPQFIDSDSVVMTLNDRKYRGRIEFVKHSDGKMSAVNVLSVNEYLYSAVPSEMYSSWPKEALKAQAVAARNYCITRFGIHKDLQYDLCDASHCQVYNGFDNEAQSTNVAVDETSNILIYYNGQPINAVFFSSSGGCTEDSENVWSSVEPYLRGVKDEYEKEGKIWNRNFTVGDIENILAKNNVNIGKVTDVRIASYTNSGRVSELQIIGTNGIKSLKKEEIRTFFGVLGGNLESRMFKINDSATNYIAIQSGNSTASKSISGLFAIGGSQNAIQLQNTEVPVLTGNSTYILKPISQLQNTTGSFYFQGYGYGHGIGMSQYGAKGMAESGFDFKQILKHYYTGVDIL